MNKNSLDLIMGNSSYDDLSHAYDELNIQSSLQSVQIGACGEYIGMIRTIRTAAERFIDGYSPQIDGYVSFAINHGVFLSELLSQFKALESTDWNIDELVPSFDVMKSAFNAFWSTLRSETITDERTRIVEQLEEDQNVEAAMSSLRNLMNSWGEHGGILSDLASLEFSLGFLDAALSHCSRAVELEPHDQDAVANLKSIKEALQAPSAG